MTLAAAWLGDWQAPWPQTRGRRWGDRAWTLQALAQAWLLGADEGRWPLVDWEARRPQGPRPLTRPTAWSTLPDEAWIARLRHGTPGIPAHQRGPREDEVEAGCWSALLDGDLAPWMALGTVLLDRETRTRWIPLVSAVEASGRLRLPPFLAPLVPEAMWRLPPGWWSGLLGSMDPEGRLLPRGEVPLDLPWEALRPHLDPLVLADLPEALAPFHGSPWLVELPEVGWMIDPGVRAWGRGWGAAPGAMQPLVPSSLAMGDAPEGLVGAVLAHRKATAGLSSDDPWARALAADLDEIPVPLLPPACGDPTLDRIRVRWGGEFPVSAPGYPDWGKSAHPCADPFHWMVEGARAFRAQAFPASLRAFGWAHAHFDRLGAEGWARRAAFNAASVAFVWADLPAHTAWARLRGPLPSPHKELETIRGHILAGEDGAVDHLLKALLRTHPGSQEAWLLQAYWAMRRQQPDVVARCLPHLVYPPVRTMAEAFLAGMTAEPPSDLSAEDVLIWRFHQALHGREEGVFWAAWDACPNHALRLETGLDLLEARPECRTGARLLAIQAIAARAGAPSPLARLRALWPQGTPSPQDLDPAVLLHRALAELPGPMWVVAGEGPDAPAFGSGAPPPEGLLARLREGGTLAPLALDGQVWWGFPLTWEGVRVGAGLASVPAGQPLAFPAGAALLAPWLARLVPAAACPETPEEGRLLADGSSPMAAVLGELRRVAPASLPVLILGPTGSGKELVAHELHRLSGRTGRMVPVNCSELAETLLESELFGHVRGAFTGADRERKGAIESADCGTLFLDEIADLSPRIQSMLLRVLQEREVRKVGSDRAARVDVRFVAATHRPLEAEVRAGGFRRDLLFRLQGTVLRLPSLHERSHELPYLLPRLVAQVAREQRRPAPEISQGLAQALARLPWPGNFRELRFALERALLRCGPGPLKPSHFPELVAPEHDHPTWEVATRAFQRQLLLDTLQRTGFKAAEAADLLGLTRPALYTAAKRLGVDLLAERARQVEAVP